MADAARETGLGRIHEVDDTASASLMLDNLARPGDVVLDCCAGSGSTLVAASREGRRAIGIEIDERYCEVAAQRFAQADLFAGEAS